MTCDAPHIDRFTGTLELTESRAESKVVAGESLRHLRRR